MAGLLSYHGRLSNAEAELTSSDSIFSGSIAALYDRFLVPMKFGPYAEDLARRVAAAEPALLLETAAGTGILTEAIARAVPGAKLVATDLNQAMLEVAAARIDSPSVSFQRADAQSLPFPDASFDIVACQFGAMFFPDRVLAYSEARRVLKPGGRFLFNVWDRIEANPATDLAARAVASVFPDDPPDFFARVPFGYHDKAAIEAELRSAGFDRIESETVVMRCRIGSAREAAAGLCQGTPLRSEIEARGSLEEATKAAEAALAQLAGPDGLDAPMSAHIFSAGAWRSRPNAAIPATASQPGLPRQSGRPR
jgi:SAM-dependent methyltransferase